MSNSSSAAAEEAKPLSKSATIAELARRSGIDKKSCEAVMEALDVVVKSQLGPGGPGTFTLGGMLKVQRVVKPATEAAVRPNPFKKGEMMNVPAKPASLLVKVRPLKKLKDMLS